MRTNSILATALSFTYFSILGFDLIFCHILEQWIGQRWALVWARNKNNNSNNNKTGKACVRTKNKNSLKYNILQLNKEFFKKRKNRKIKKRNYASIKKSYINNSLYGFREFSAKLWLERRWFKGFPGGTRVKNPPANAGGIRYTSSLPGSGRWLGGGHGNPLQCS